MFGKKTVTSVIAKLNKMVEELDEVAESAKEDVEDQTAIILSATQAQGEARGEAERAQRIGDKIAELVS